MTTMNAIYPSENPWSSFNNNSTKTHNLSLAFPSQKDYGLWSGSPLPSTNKNDFPTSPDESWGKTTAALIEAFQKSPIVEQAPTEIVFQQDWDDDVSVLEDDPDNDDIGVVRLPESTYGVLMPLFDELGIEADDQDYEDDGPARAA